MLRFAQHDNGTKPVMLSEAKHLHNNSKDLCRNYLYRMRRMNSSVQKRRREACRGTLTDDNAAMADSDKHNV